MLTSRDIKKINNVDKLNMKQLFNLKKRLIQDTNLVGLLLDSKIMEKWNFHYSETDDDAMIDTLDYGTQEIGFKCFCNIMEEYKD